MARRVTLPHEKELFNEIVPTRTTKYVFPHKYFASDARTDDHIYFRYSFPGDWTNVDSTRKSIAFRTARITRKFTGTIGFTFEGKVNINEKPSTFKFDEILTIYEQNSVVEIMQALVDKVNKDLQKKYAEQACNIELQLRINTNADRSLSMRLNLITDDAKIENAVIQSMRPDDPKNFLWQNFRIYFNQPLTTTKYDFAIIYSDPEGATDIAECVIDDVWNMDMLYFHSDFASGSEGGLMAREGDFYQHPIKYPYPGRKTEFTIWVSFDGKTPTRLNSQDFLVELDFIANSDQNYND